VADGETLKTRKTRSDGRGIGGDGERRADVGRALRPVETAVDEDVTAATADEQRAVTRVLLGAQLDLASRAEEAKLHVAP
jgi:hypothetical protein